MIRKIVNKLKKLNIITIIILGIVLYLVAFYFQRNFKNREVLYAIEILAPGGDFQSAVPIWVADTLQIGDQDKSVLGQVNAEIIDKETYEGGGYGKHTILLIKVYTSKDKSGAYIFKNKPLAINWYIDTRFNKTNYGGIVTYLDKNPPQYEKKVIRVILERRSDEIYNADSIKVGSEMVNNKGEVMAKIVDKKITPAEIRLNTTSGQSVVTYDTTRRDVDITVDLLTKKIGDVYYFAETKKIKIDEKINLHFKELSLWDSKIIKVIEIEQPSPAPKGPVS